MSSPGDTPFDPTRIDISLDMIGGSSIQRVETLIQALSTVTRELAKISSAIPETQVQGQSQMVAGIRQGGRGSSTSHSAAPSPEDTGENTSRSWVPSPEQQDAIDARIAADNTLRDQSARGLLNRLKNDTDPGSFQTLRGMGQAIRHPLSTLQDEAQVYGARERVQSARRPGSVYRPQPGSQNLNAPNGLDLDGTMAPGVGDIPPATQDGEPGPDSSIPLNALPPQQQALRSNQRQYESAHEPISMLQFGQYTTENKLNWAADYLTRRSARQYESAYQDAAATREPGMGMDEFNATIAPTLNQGETSALLSNLTRMAAGQAGNLSILHGNAQKLYNFGSDVNTTGTEAGYQRSTSQITIPGTDISFGNPYDTVKGAVEAVGGFLGIGHGGDTATSEGLREKLTVQRLGRGSRGITNEQAKEAVSTLQQLGWSGDENQNLSLDILKPLMQQGLNGNVTATMLDHAMRNGTDSTESFREALDDLGPSARRARMSLTEYQESLDEFAKNAEQQGATYTQGLQAGKDFTTGTGLTPQQAASASDSSLVQGMGFSRYGIVPGAFGLLSGGQQANATEDAVAMAMGAFKGLTPPPGSGISAEDYQAALAARATGMSPATVKKLWDNRNQIRPASLGASALSRFSEAHKFVETQGTDDQKDHVDDAGTMLRLDGKDASWNSVEKQLMATASAAKTPAERSNLTKQVEKINSESGDKRIKDAKGFFDKINTPVDDNKPTVYVKFKGTAAKLFEQVDAKKLNANGGGDSINSVSASVAAARRSMSSLGSLAQVAQDIQP